MPDTIPLEGQNCPAWRRNTVRHASGMLSAIIPESCPSWAGTRNESDRLRRQEVERARYEADLARRRFMHVDPGNRLVADSLEAEWNQTLRALSEAQERYEKQKQTDSSALSDKQRKHYGARERLPAPVA